MRLKRVPKPIVSHANTNSVWHRYWPAAAAAAAAAPVMVPVRLNSHAVEWLSIRMMMTPIRRQKRRNRI
jgi:hypothetical protein